MSIDGSKKEFIYSTFLKFNKGLIEKAVRIELENVDLERNIAGRRIDIVADTNNDFKFYGEVQLTEGDLVHLQQIERLINDERIEKNIIVAWFALGFSDKILSRIEEMIDKSNKNIEFVAIRLSKKLLEPLQTLNNLHQLKIVDNFNFIEVVENQLLVVRRYFRLKDDGRLGCKEDKYIEIRNEEDRVRGEKEEILNKIVVEMREQLYYYLPVHRSKNVNGNYIVLGAGAFDVNFGIGINRYNYLYSHIRFGSNQKKLFELFYSEKKEELDNYFDYRLEWNTKGLKIETFIWLEKEKIDRQIKEIVKIMDKYIKFFVEHIVG